MPKVSINLLTKNRSALLPKALASIKRQSFSDYEVIIVNDGSSDDTAEVLKNSALKDLRIISHATSEGITQSRQEALLASRGEYIAILDDDDEWVDTEKLSKQVGYLDTHRDYVLVGGGVEIFNFEFPMSHEIQNSKSKIIKLRPSSDSAIRNTMLFKNNFFTSTVMFRKEAALKAGGFIKDQSDFAEDYDLWLRIGRLGKMYNFSQVFTAYIQSRYNKEKFRRFLAKQLNLVQRHKTDYPFYYLAIVLLRLRLLL